MLSRLIYASQAVRPMNEDALTGLLATARNNNQRLGLTGLLLYCNQSFLQMLEGSPEKVDAIYEKIGRDDRHRNLRLLSRSATERRKYPDWSMGFEHVDEDQLAATLPGYRPATQYPLVSSDLIRNGTVAETLLDLYRRNTPGA